MIVLYGAGTTGRVVARDLKAKGTPAACFADNNPDKYEHPMEGLPVMSPADALRLFPDALWLASVVRPERKEIKNHIVEMGVRTEPLWGYLPAHHELPDEKTQKMLLDLTADVESYWMLKDQFDFRQNPDYEAQRIPSDINDVYFPDFIRHREDEHYVDCGAADGDTVKEFRKRWPKYAHITAYEPDIKNYIKLTQYHCDLYDSMQGNNMTVRHYALGSHHRKGVPFISTGDQSAHIGEGNASVELQALDNFTDSSELPAIHKSLPPTYIKMDIEGSELEALWGARNLIQKYSPVLAICAYHASEDLWQIPLFLHMLKPDYKFYFRRYAEGAWEIVWYAVPKERVQ